MTELGAETAGKLFGTGIVILCRIAYWVGVNYAALHFIVKYW